MIFVTTVEKEKESVEEEVSEEESEINPENQSQNQRIQITRLEEIKKRKKIQKLKKLESLPDDLPNILLRVSNTFFRTNTNKKIDEIKESPGVKKAKLIGRIDSNRSSAKKEKLSKSNSIIGSHRDKEKVIEIKSPSEIPQFLKNSLQESFSQKSNSMNATCLICYDNTSDAVFIDCGHGGLCYSCSLDIWKKTGECYLCRAKVTRIVQIESKKSLRKEVKIKRIMGLSQRSVSMDEDDSQSIVRELSEEKLPTPRSILSNSSLM